MTGGQPPRKEILRNQRLTPVEVTAAHRDARTFRADLRHELARLLHRPGEELLTILTNALLVCGGWSFLPPAAKSWLFTLQGPLAFAVVLAGWMLSDTPSTNMLGNDTDGALAALSTYLRDQERG